jgi:hypothetical protein
VRACVLEGSSFVHGNGHKSVSKHWATPNPVSGVSIIGVWERRDKPAWRSGWKSRTSKE